RAASWTAWPPALPSWRDLPRAPLGAAGAVVLALAAALWWWRVRGGAMTADAVPAFYARALRLLARRGLTPAAGETAREFSARARGQAPACAAPLARLTAGYERVRFGGARLSGAEAAELDGCLSMLEKAR
ncbi:MAG: DUF4129 domain-containing protein, partial [Candidatus Rokuibacteriota bacterium]